MAKQVIILYGRESDAYSDECFQSCQDAVIELSDADYNFMRQNLHHLNDWPTVYHMIDFVPKTELADLKARVMNGMAAVAARREADAKREEERKARQRANATERKKRQLAKLKKEFGEA